MAVVFSRVVDAQPRRLPGFSALDFIDLEALRVYASPLAVLDDFRVSALPFSAHPHAGFSAVTYVFEDSPGAVRSRTSTGADLVVGAGGIVWTQAGRGVIHEEIPARKGVELHGLQLFINITSTHKLSPPRVLSLQGADVPVWEREGATVRVVVGTFGGVASPLVPDERFTMLDMRVRSGISYWARTGENTVLYVLDGELAVRWAGERHRVSRGQALALSGTTEDVSLEVADAAHLLVLSGAAISEPVVEEGPFIMNDRAQIQAAIARYRSGEMGGLSPV